MKRLKVITVSLMPIHIKLLDELVNEKLYGSRAETIRLAIRDLLILHKKVGNY